MGWTLSHICSFHVNDFLKLIQNDGSGHLFEPGFGIFNLTVCLQFGNIKDDW